ncbi:peptidase C65 Otubain-domain-containing protein [Aspergillus unguis]
MSLSDLPRNHLYPLDQYQPRKDYFTGYFHQPLASSAFFGHQTSQPSSTIYTHTPEFFNMSALSPEEMERYQELSNRYEPELPGPLVSQKQSTHLIAMEYANADPAFATKTAGLAVTHPQSRIMKGDGNCGWRAVAFGYFENLFNRRDLTQVNGELTRIKSLSTLLDQVGQDENLYEIFVDATEEVFENISSAIHHNQRDDTFLVELFNDEYKSSAIITHFRLLTSAWMKLNPLRYQAFISQPLDQYCATRIETVKTEIDEVGLQALIDGVIERSGLMVEILYLDRSQGDVVTPHVLTQTRPGIGAIRLLYRPGHYDLLYGAEPAVQMQPVVNLQYAMSSDYMGWGANDLSFDVNSGLMAIPGFAMDTFAPPMSQPPPNEYRVSLPQEVYQPPMYSPPPRPIATPQPPIQLSGPPPPPLSALPRRTDDGPQIRMNEYVMRSNLSQSHPVTTAPFKNSHHNPNHFQSSEFEPDHWSPTKRGKKSQ